MGRSRNIIDSMLESLKLFLGDPLYLYERYRIAPSEIEGRQDIKKARIALYELDERVNTRVDASRANLSDQRYGMDISVPRAYAKSDASRGELPLLDVRDKIIDWAAQVDAGGVTNSAIFTFGYESSGGITRETKYVTATLVFSSLRDLQPSQTNI
jgi:hypothetical protein